jgi:ATPase family associated with various cellular activities (AAA)
MPEPVTNDTSTTGAASEVAQRMSREVAIMGARLAQLIARSPMAQEPAVAQGHDFLHAMYNAACLGIEIDLSADMSSRGARDTTHPIDRLIERMGLTSIEIDLVLLAAMTEEHEGYASVLRSLNPRNEPYATVGLAAQLVNDRLRDRFAIRRVLHQGAAVRSNAIAISGVAPFFEKNLTLADNLWPALCGIEAYPAGLRRFQVNAALNGLQDWIASAEVRAACEALGRFESRVVLVIAESETAAVNRAVAIVAAFTKRWLAFDHGTNTPAGSERVALLHCLVRDAVPIFRLAAGDGSAPLPGLDLENFPGPVILCVRRGANPILSGSRVMMIEAEPLSAIARQRMWRETLPELADDAPILAARYAIEPAAAMEAADDMRAQANLIGGAISLKTAAECVRVRSNIPLGAGIKMVRPTARWDQLVLPPDRRTLLAEALNRLIHQATVLDRWKFLEGRPGARGVRVLLSGPPGTGKTLSAEVMAHSLGVDLMVVDISRVVSKWIGETEKHLAQAFDIAEQSQAVLLFDEADALFGKRTEVSDAHDRYANLETAYLLSRLERFNGLTVLSTNLKQNIDPAFLRRLEFVIELDEPSAVEREALWRSHLPSEAPLSADVDLKQLAGLYPIVGGLIRNASVAAGFLAAASNTSIGRDHLIGAIRREYEKSGKAFPGVPAGVLPV